MSNLEIWDKLKSVPAESLKKIEAGRLRGKSDINPQWRYKVLTETFGMCGTGWKYTIDRQWLEHGDNGQIVAFVNVSLYVKQNGEWSEAIPANGGSMFIANEKNGAFTSDEAFKMATTDALGTAAKMIGVAADVYMGILDTKYNVQPTQNQQVPQTPKNAQPEKPWLTQVQFEKAEARIIAGEEGVLVKLQENFRIKTEYLTKLKAAHEHFTQRNN